MRTLLQVGVVLRRVLAGIVWGIGAATVLTGFVAVTTLLGTSGTFDRLGLSWGLVLRSYYTGGILAGALFGVARPLTRTIAGAVLFGALLGAIVYASAAWVLDDPTRLAGMWRSAFLTGAVVGACVGAAMWYAWSHAVKLRSEALRQGRPPGPMRIR